MTPARQHWPRPLPGADWNFPAIKHPAMEYLDNLLALAGIWLVAVVTPGPDFVAVSHAGLARSRAEGLKVAMGVNTGMICWALAAVFGLEAVFSHWPWLYPAVKTAGAIYLMVMGVQLILDARGEKPFPPSRRGPAGGAFRRGLLTNLSNPKAAVIFGSLISVVFPANIPFWVQCSAVLLIAGISMVWYAAVAMLLSEPRVARVYRKAKGDVDRIAGGIFLFIGSRLAASD